MNTPDLDAARRSVLDQMERAARTTRLAMLGAAAVEGVLMVVALLMVDWHDRLQVLLFLFSVLSYSIVGLGLFALGGHVSRVGARVAAVVEAAGGR
ncbi:MAG: hypothetical protein JO040_04145 [Gemmatimonadetes bacterium]|nr:hypothetical protein [Gemmatimonadota bacterium]